MAWYAGVLELPSPTKWVILTLGIVALVAFAMSMIRLILAFRANGKVAHLYENRSELPPLTDSVAKAEEVWVSWRVGSVAKTLPQELWNNVHFKRMLLHHPNPAKGEPHYLKAHVLGFPNRTLKELCEDIFSATRQAPEHIDVRWFNGYLGDSLLIVNPHHPKKKGWIRVELTTAASQAADRPSVRITEKHYPHLFRTLVTYYEQAFEKAEKPPEEYRQHANLQVLDKVGSQP